MRLAYREKKEVKEASACLLIKNFNFCEYRKLNYLSQLHLFSWSLALDGLHLHIET